MTGPAHSHDDHDDHDDGGVDGASVVELVERAVLSRFADAPARASVSFVGVEPIEILRLVDGGDTVYVSIGMSRHPMTGAASDHVSPNGPRAELVWRVRDPAGDYPQLWRHLAVLAAAPAVESVVHRAGATIDLGSPLAPGSRWTGFVIGEPIWPAVEVRAGGAQVKLLAALPATATELAWARVHGGSALLARWEQHGADLADPLRAPVALT